MPTSFMIAAPTSGAGKTLVSQGLMAACVRRSLVVQPFKCGPDYIDTKFHARVCGRGSVNLDRFMASDAHLQTLFRHYGTEADVCVVEGMMGLFDGYDRDHGSAASVAQLLGLPVVLVVDASHTAYSLTALLRGFKGFRADVHIAGIVFNKVGSERHRRLLQQVADDADLKCYGFLPRRKDFEVSSRYLGLDFSEATCHRIDDLARFVEEHLAVDALLGDFRMEPTPPDVPLYRPRSERLQIGVARSDESFSFLYREHIDLFRSMGDVTFFNPEEAVDLPPSLDLLYLPGGYPEKHAAALAAAQSTRQSILRYAQRGGRILAECGGLIYLCRGVHCSDGYYPLVGVFDMDVTARDADRRLSLGYRQFDLAGQHLRGHEFHYTQLCGAPQGVAAVSDATGRSVPTQIFRYRNVVAGYNHLYLGESDVMALF